MSENIDREKFTMRAPCKHCGETLGRVAEKNGQDTVRCLGCGKHCYNAPRTETGREARSVRTLRKDLKPSDRARILERDGHRCVLCGATPNDPNVRLDVGHVVSVDAGLATGLSNEEINDDENLIAQCVECNLGQGSQPIPLRTAIAILHARISWRDKEAAK